VSRLFGSPDVVGKNYAVLERGSLRTSGFLTWLVWAFVHILSLPQLQNRLRVLGVIVLLTLPLLVPVLQLSLR
jgi:NADH dehydrogenase FAD-containing subunit